MTDSFDLQRFVAAQDPLYADVLAELRPGRRRSHWMWFVFPQHAALGRSAMAARYGLASRAEAAAYWQHRRSAKNNPLPRAGPCGRVPVAFLAIGFAFMFIQIASARSRRWSR